MTPRRCGSARGYADHIAAGTPACDPCKAAHARRQQQYRKRSYLAGGHIRIDATGTRRRIQALAVGGWSTGAIGELLGVNRNAVHRWSRELRITRENAARIAALYDELWDQPGPSLLTAKYAARNGWLPPLAWDDDLIDDPTAGPSWSAEPSTAPPAAFDEIAVQQAMRGYPVPLRRAERLEATRRLTALGVSASEIAERIGVEPRTVNRLRQALREDLEGAA